MWFLVVLNVLCVLSFLFCLLEAVCFLNFWFVLELLTLSVIPYFFRFLPSYRSVFQFVIISSFSSFFLVAGLLVPQYQIFFVVLGVLMKLGVFPFLSWAYEVVVFSNWVIIWFFSGVLKIPFVLLFYVCSGGLCQFVVSLLCAVSFVLIAVNFWKITSGWRYLWCHMMLSSSVSLVVVSVFCPFVSVFLVYSVYFVWSCLVLSLFSFFPPSGRLFGGFWVLLYVVLLVSFPPSVVVLYKYVLCTLMLSVPVPVFVAWCFCTIAEQLFVVFFVVSRNVVRSFGCLFSLV